MRSSGFSLRSASSASPRASMRSATAMAAAVILISMAINIQTVQGWTFIGCFRNIGEKWPSTIRYESGPYTRASCEQLAINNKKNYFGLTAGGDACEVDNNYNTDVGDSCDWDSHADEAEGTGYWGGPNGRMSVYSTTFPACPLTSKYNSFANSAWGSCSSSLANGACCNFACTTGWTVASASVCCSKTDVTGSPSCGKNCIPPTLTTNMNIGTCNPTSQPAGSSCSVTCTLPYVIQGSTTVSCPASTTGAWSGSQTCGAPCTGPPTPVAAGNWTLLSPAQHTPGVYQIDTQFALSCPSGWSAINSPARCLSTSQWSTGAFCLDLRMKPKLSIDLTTMSPYSGLVTWTNEVVEQLQLPSSSMTHRYKPTLVFPSPTGPDRLESPLTGVQFVAGTSFTSSGTNASAQLTADLNGEIEHARFALTIETTYKDPTSGQVTVGPQTTNSISLPCACNQEGALLQTLIEPTDALMYGTPLSPRVLQTLDDSNSLLLRFMPNSLCTDYYTIHAVAHPDGVAPDSDGSSVSIDIIPAKVSQLHLENQQSCGFLTEQSDQFAQVKWPIHGRPLQVCIQPLPRIVCSTCTSSYGTELSEGPVFKMPATCVTYTPKFWVTVQGKVTTPISTFSKEAAPVSEVLIILQILDPVTLQVIYIPSATNPNVTEPLQVQVKTDERGRYSLQLSSDKLTERSYGVRVIPAKNDTNPDTGIVFPHVFSVVNQADVAYYDDSMSHGQTLSSINFYDESEVAVRGVVELPSDQSTPDAFQACRVGGVVISAYSRTDTDFVAPVRRTPVTTNNGEFVLSVPLFVKLTLVPTYEGSQLLVGETTTPVHTFSPERMYIDVRQSTIQLEPFLDTTQAEFSAEFFGGECNFHIGVIRPVARILSCGDSAHVKLSQFGSAGATWRLPAMLYQFSLYDGQDPTAGLQATDLGGYELPDSYLYGPLRDWILTREPVQVDLRPVLVAPKAPHLTYKYIAVADINLVRKPTCIDTAVENEANSKYLYLYANSVNSIPFDLSELYGYIDKAGGNRQRTCRQVETGVTILDDVTNAGEALFYYYQEDEYGCTTGDLPCTMKTVYNANFSTSIATYLMRVGGIERTENTDSTGARFAPAYTRKLQYRLAGSVLPWQVLHVAILGTYSFPGSVSLMYPPQDALFILRDPPGGSSTASLTQGSSIDIESSISSTTGTSSDSSFDLGFGGGQSVTTCKGIGVEACTMDIDVQTEFKVETAMSVGGSSGTTATEATSVGIEQTVSTSDNPLFHDGDGDLFLTVAGTIQMSSAVSVEGRLVQRPGGAIGDNICETTLRPSVSWQKDPTNTYAWSSAYDIKNVVIPSFQKANAKILKQFDATDGWSLKARAPTAYFNQYADNEIQVAGWQGLLDYNQKLKDESVAWPEFWQAMSETDTDSNKDTVSQMLTEAQQQAAASGGSVSVTASDPADQAGTGSDDGLNSAAFASVESVTRGFQLDSSAGIGSVTFFGASSTLSFTLTTSSTKSSTREIALDVGGTVGLRTTFDSKFFGVDAGYELATSASVSYSHGNSNTRGRTMTRSISINLADPDMGDMFQVEIRNDPVYGSPVYRIKGGQSRCAWEQGTVSRDDMRLSFAQSSFEHVNPYAKVSTVLSLINNSPTEESFTYTLEVPHETNLYGLKISINGQILATGVGVTLTYNQALRLTVDIERGSNGYLFEGIQFALKTDSGIETPDGTPACLEVSTNFNIQYDEPCSQVEFAGALASTPSFIVNQLVTSATSDGQPVLSIVIRNPETTLTGRRWLDKFEEGFLQSIKLEYRSAPTGQVLSDLDWSPVLTTGSDGVPIDVLATIKDTQDRTGIDAGDFFSVMWDMAPLADGPYQVRAISQCKAPIGVLDSSLYVHATTAVLGSLDIEPPRVFGTPVPSVKPFLPGQPIEVVFDQTINCAGYFGKARAFAWVNAGLTAMPRAQGLQLSVTYVCKQSTLGVSLNFPLWTELVNRLVTIQVDRVRDTGGNEIENQVTWSFYVDNFVVSDSPIRVSNLNLKGTPDYGDLVASYGNVAKFEQSLAQEVADLINLSIDTILRPTPSATYGVNGLQRGGVIINELKSVTSTSLRFGVDLLPLPIFPGEPKPLYSPSDFAHYLGVALTPINQTAALIGESVTVEDETTTTSSSSSLADAAAADAAKALRTSQIRRLYADNVTFPLLSHFVSSSSSSFDLKLLPTEETVASQQALTNRRASRRHTRTITRPIAQRKDAADDTPTAPPTVTPITSVSNYDAAAASNIVVLRWQAYDEQAQSLTAANLKLSYMNIAEEVDPNLIFDDDSTVTAGRIEINVATQAAFSQSVIAAVDEDPSLNITGSRARALYQIILFSVPAKSGGRTTVFRVNVLNVTDAEVAEPYGLEHSVFLVSTPTKPHVRSVSQITVDTFEIRFNPVWSNGLASSAGDADVTYSVRLTGVSTQDATTSVSLTIPDSKAILERYTDVLGTPLVRIICSVSNMTGLGFALPSSGKSVSWSTNLVASTNIGSTSSDLRTITMNAEPAPLAVKAIEQIGADRFTVRFQQPTSHTPGVGIDTMRVTFAYALADGNITEGAATLNWATSVTTLVDASTATFEFTLDLDSLAARSNRLTWVAAGAQVAGPFGLSALRMFNTSALVFVSAPRAVGLTVLNGTRTNGTELLPPTQAVLIAWDAPAQTYPTLSLLTKYRVSWKLTDGLHFSTASSETIEVAADAATRESTLIVPLIRAPVDNVPLVYTFSVDAVLTNGVASEPSSVILLAVDQNFISYFVRSIDAIESQTTFQRSAVSRAAAANLATQLVSSSYVQTSEAGTDANLPSAPTSFDMFQVSPGRLVLRFPVSTSGAPTAYVVAWSEAAPAASTDAPDILGTLDISPSRAIDGVITAQVADASFDVPTPGLGPQRHTFFVSLHAVNSYGASPRTSKYVSVMSSSLLVSSSDSWPSWYSELIIAIIVLNGLILILQIAPHANRLYHGRTRKNAQVRSIDTDGDDEFSKAQGAFKEVTPGTPHKAMPQDKEYVAIHVDQPGKSIAASSSGVDAAPIVATDLNHLPLGDVKPTALERHLSMTPSSSSSESSNRRVLKGVRPVHINGANATHDGTSEGTKSE